MASTNQQPSRAKEDCEYSASHLHKQSSHLPATYSAPHRSSPPAGYASEQSSSSCCLSPRFQPIPIPKVSEIFEP
ncbi:hypothetical protein Bca101_007985 [Brassica carinata]